MIRNTFFALAATISIFSACSYDTMVNKLAPKAEVDFAKLQLEQLRKGQHGEFKSHLDAELLTPGIDSVLEELTAYFPKEDPIEIKLIGSNTLKTPNSWTVNLTFQYQFQAEWAVANIALARDSEDLIVQGVHVNLAQKSLQEINAFTIRDKPLLHYVFLCFFMAAIVTILFALVLCIRTPIRKRKWLWIIFILLGFVSLKFNWTTGQIMFQPLSMYLFAVAAKTGSPYSPWILTISAPLGAIFFLLGRNTFDTIPYESGANKAL